MTITYGVHGRIVELTLDDTVTFHHPIGEATQRLVPPPRRPKVDPKRFEQRVRIPRSITVVDEPALTTELPALVEYSLRPRRPDSVPQYVGRHHRPGPLARLARALRLGRRDGA